MKFELHGLDVNGLDDCIIIEGSSIEEIKTKAKKETESRLWTDCWSRELDDE
jgi:hypothetical protein